MYMTGEQESAEQRVEVQLDAKQSLADTRETNVKIAPILTRSDHRYRTATCGKRRRGSLMAPNTSLIIML